MFHVKHKAAFVTPLVICSMLIIITCLVITSAPTESYAVNATDGTTYSDQLLNDGNKSTHDYGIDGTQSWVDDTILNQNATGYHAEEGDFQGFASNLRKALTDIFQWSLGIILLLFGAKIAGRGISTLIYKDDTELFNNLNQFFMTARERSSRKPPSVLTSSFGRAMGAGRGGKGRGPQERDYTGASYIDPHPYVEFFKELVIALTIAFGIWAGIEVVLGIVTQIFDMNNGSMTQRQQIFGNLSERL